MKESTGYLGDRVEIDDLLTRYASAIDTREWDLLDSVFTADADLDYRSAGGISGTYPEIKAWLAKVLPMFTWTQHLVLNRVVELDPTGDSGRSRCGFGQPEWVDHRRQALALYRGRQLSRPTDSNPGRMEDRVAIGGDDLVGQPDAGPAR